MIVFATVLSLILAAPPPADFASLRDQAEESYAEKSFGRAHELYEQASRLALAAADRRWVEFRLIDTSWRSVTDSWQYEKDRGKLDKLVQNEEHDRTWAEASESLADLQAKMWSSSGDQQLYRQALDWWGGSSDIALARERYLAIVFRMLERQRDPQEIPRDVLLNALEIAPTEGERAHLRFAMAQQLFAQRKPASRERGLELLDQIIALGKQTSWYAPALAAEAAQLDGEGSVVVVGGKAEEI